MTEGTSADAPSTGFCESIGIPNLGITHTYAAVHKNKKNYALLKTKTKWRSAERKENKAEAIEAHAMTSATPSGRPHSGIKRSNESITNPYSSYITKSKKNIHLWAIYSTSPIICGSSHNLPLFLALKKQVMGT